MKIDTSSRDILFKKFLAILVIFSLTSSSVEYVFAAPTFQKPPKECFLTTALSLKDVEFPSSMVANFTVTKWAEGLPTFRKRIETVALLPLTVLLLTRLFFPSIMQSQESAPTPTEMALADHFGNPEGSLPKADAAPEISTTELGEMVDSLFDSNRLKELRSPSPSAKDFARITATPAGGSSLAALFIEANQKDDYGFRASSYRHIRPLVEHLTALAIIDVNPSIDEFSQDDLDLKKTIAQYESGVPKGWISQLRNPLFMSSLVRFVQMNATRYDLVPSGGGIVIRQGSDGFSKTVNQAIFLLGLVQNKESRKELDELHSAVNKQNTLNNLNHSAISSRLRIIDLAKNFGIQKTKKNKAPVEQNQSDRSQQFSPAAAVMTLEPKVNPISAKSVVKASEIRPLMDLDEDSVNAINRQLLYFWQKNSISGEDAKNLFSEDSWKSATSLRASQIHRTIRAIKAIDSKTNELFEQAGLNPSTIPPTLQTRMMFLTFTALGKQNSFKTAQDNEQRVRETVEVSVRIAMESYREMSYFLNDVISRHGTVQQPTQLVLRPLLQPLLDSISGEAPPSLALKISLEKTFDMLGHLSAYGSNADLPIIEELNRSLRPWRYVVDLGLYKNRETGVVFVQGGLYEITDATTANDLTPLEGLTRLWVQPKAIWQDSDNGGDTQGFIVQGLPETIAINTQAIREEEKIILGRLFPHLTPISLITSTEQKILDHIFQVAFKDLDENQIDHILTDDVVIHEELHMFFQRFGLRNRSGLFQTRPKEVREVMEDEYASYLGTISFSKSPLYRLASLARFLPENAMDPVSANSIVALQIFSDLQPRLNKMGTSLSSWTRPVVLGWIDNLTKDPDVEKEIGAEAETLYKKRFGVYPTRGDKKILESA